MKFTKIAAVVALGMIATSAMAVPASNLVTNGSFEHIASNGNNQFDPLGGGWTYTQTDKLFGWKSTNSALFEVQLATTFQTATPKFASSYDGSRQYVELNSNKAGGITQTLTTKDKWYTLSFGYADRAEDIGPNLASSMQVVWNGKVIDTITTADTKWTTYSYTVESLDHRTDLSFVSVGPSATSTYGSYLDGVSVMASAAPVPEPESYAMLVAGLGLMAVIARRKSKAAE